MARGKKSTQVIFFNLRTDGTDGHPVFLVKSGEKQEQARFVSGRLKDIMTKTIEGKKGPFIQVALSMEDGEERYLVSFSLTILGRSILNSLANAKKIDQVAINLYKSKQAKPAVYVEINGEKSSWAYTKEDVEKKFMKKGVFDVKAFDDALLKEVPCIKENIVFLEDTNETDIKEGHDIQESTEELPF